MQAKRRPLERFVGAARISARGCIVSFYSPMIKTGFHDPRRHLFPHEPCHPVGLFVAPVSIRDVLESEKSRIGKAPSKIVNVVQARNRLFLIHFHLVS